MPANTTALEIIKTAMRQIGVIATGETPSAAEAADGLSALNDVLETWNTEGLAVWQNAAQTFVATPGVASYTVGPTGTIVTTGARPVRIIALTTSFQGVDFPASQWTYQQYLGLPIKATGATFPSNFAYLNDYPNGQIFLWPVPAVAVTLNLDLQVQIAAITSLATALAFPPGYARALQWDLAAELCSQYGTGLNDIQIALARASKAAVKKANHVPSVSAIDPSLMRGPVQTWLGG